jgi:hypothetical protein
MPLWGTASGPPPPMAEGGGAEGSAGSSSSSGAAAIRSLLPTRRRLRLDPPSKLYFPCTYAPRAPGLSHQFPLLSLQGRELLPPLLRRFLLPFLLGA